MEVSNFSKTYGEIPHNINQNCGIRPLIGDQYALKKACLLVPDPKFACQAQLSSYTVATFRIFKPSKILYTACRYQQSNLFLAI